MSEEAQSYAEEPLLSVIIVAYKSCDEIGPCLASIPRVLCGGAVECIVVNNSMDAETDDLIGEDYPWVRTINPGANLGFGRGNNLGYASARGRYILFLNPDTVCNEAALVHCIGLVESRLEVGLVSPKLVMADGSMDLACRRSVPTLWDGFCRATGLATLFPSVSLFSGYNLTHLDEGGSHYVGAINGAFLLGRRAVFERISQGPEKTVFDEAFFMYGDDLDLCIRVSQAGFKILYEGGVQIIHLKGLSVGKEYDRMSRAIFDANRDVYLKHFNPGNSALIRWKYQVAFGLWKSIALLRAKVKGHRKVRPV